MAEWLPDQTLQCIARENNLAETAFFVPLAEPDQFHIRWFTPTTEVPLCGHATLASAYAIFNCLKTNPAYPAGRRSDKISFQSLSGWLHVQREGDWLTLDFPTDTLHAAALPDAARDALHILPKEVYRGRENFLLVYESEAEVLALAPDFRVLKTAHDAGFICTAPGSESDFVSRCFFPAYGIDEDPVTGSAHTSSTPYWVEKLGKNPLTAIQVSERRGHLRCTLAGERVLMSGQAVLFLEGNIEV